MNTCRRCETPTQRGLCLECELDDSQEYHQQRAQEMLDADQERDQNE